MGGSSEASPSGSHGVARAPTAAILVLLTLIAVVAAVLRGEFGARPPQDVTIEPPAKEAVIGSPLLDSRGPSGVEEADGTATKPTSEPALAVFTVSGEVRRKDTGVPVSGGSIYFVAQRSSMVVPEPLRVSSEGGFAGRVLLSNEGQYYIFYDDGRAFLSAPTRVRREREGFRAELLAVQSAYVRVLVEDWRGRPAPSAEVTTRGAVPKARATTDAAGRCRMRVPHDLLGFWANSPDGARGTSEVAVRPGPGADVEHTIRLSKPWISVPLRVVSSSQGGDAREAVEVSVQAMGRGARLALVIGGEAQTIDVPPDQPVFLVARAGNSVVGRLRWDPPLSTRRTGITLPVVRQATVQIHAVDERGAAVAGLLIALIKKHGDNNSNSMRRKRRARTAQSNHEGIAAFERVEYGEYSILVAGLRTPSASLSIRSPVVRERRMFTDLAATRGTLKDIGMLKGKAVKVAYEMGDSRWSVPVDPNGSWGAILADVAASAPLLTKLDVLEEGRSIGSLRFLSRVGSETEILSLARFGTLCLRLTSPARQHVKVTLARVGAMETLQSHGFRSVRRQGRGVYVDGVLELDFPLLPPGEYVLTLEPADGPRSSRELRLSQGAQTVEVGLPP